MAFISVPKERSKTTVLEKLRQASNVFRVYGVLCKMLFDEKTLIFSSIVTSLIFHGIVRLSKSQSTFFCLVVHVFRYISINGVNRENIQYTMAAEMKLTKTDFSLVK